MPGREAAGGGDCRACASNGCPCSAYGLGLPRVRPPAARVRAGRRRPARTTGSSWRVCASRPPTAPSSASKAPTAALTLANANLAARADLADKIGTPEHRGSRALPYWGDEFGAWETMASYARDIEAEDYPYIAFGLPGSPTPTVNSTSAIASLIHYSGLDPTQRLPYGMHLSPGMATLLGTGADDSMRTEHGFTTLLGGAAATCSKAAQRRGRSRSSTAARATTSSAGRPGSTSCTAGSRSSPMRPTAPTSSTTPAPARSPSRFNRHWIPHKVPNFVAVFGCRRRSPVLGRAHPVERQDRPHRARQRRRPLGGQARLASRSARSRRRQRTWRETRRHGR